MSAPAPTETSKTKAGPDLSALTSMLNARWKGSAAPASSGPEPLNVGQIRSFRIAKIDREALTIEVTLA